MSRYPFCMVVIETNADFEMYMRQAFRKMSSVIDVLVCCHDACGEQ